MKTLQTLISLAREKVHTDRELADLIGEQAQNLNAMKNGRRPVSPETVAKLCAVLSTSPEDAREWLAISLIENPKNSGRAEVLRKAFFASSVGAMVMSFLSPTHADAQTKCATIQGVEVCPANGMTGEQQQAADKKKQEASRLKKPKCANAKWIEQDGWACPETLQKKEIEDMLKTSEKKSSLYPAFGTVATGAESSVYYVNSCVHLKGPIPSPFAEASMPWPRQSHHTTLIQPRSTGIKKGSRARKPHRRA